MKPYKVDKGAEMCVAVTKEGIKIYGNIEGFATLSRWFVSLAVSKPSDHDEVHLYWHMTSYEMKVGEVPRSVWMLFDKNVLQAFDQESIQDGRFDLTFMVVEQGDIDNLRKCEASGLLLEDWYEEGEESGND